MKNRIIMWSVFITSVLLVAGCSNINNDELNYEDIENHVPYIDEFSGEIDDSIISERYKTVNKEELTYNTIQETEDNSSSEQITKIYSVMPRKEDKYYKSILQGFTYRVEGSLINIKYEEALELIKKVLPDDIEQVDYKLDNELNKGYIYFKSEKGNFRVGLCYEEQYDREEINKNSIIGLDYSKEFK